MYHVLGWLVGIHLQGPTMHLVGHMSDSEALGDLEGSVVGDLEGVLSGLPPGQPAWRQPHFRRQPVEAQVHLQA